MKIRSWRIWLVRCGVCAAAVLTAVTVAEVGLRAAAWWMKGGAPSPVAGRVTILCVGDSWTWGAESGDRKRRSYPAQLQSMLDRQLPGRYTVVNRGRPGMSSKDLVGMLPGLMQEHRPQVVLVLIGGVVWVVPRAGGAVLRRRPPAAEGPLSRLRVVRLLNTLRRPAGFDNSPRLVEQSKRLNR